MYLVGEVMMSLRNTMFSCALPLGIVFLSIQPVSAASAGIKDAELVIGQCAALAGPAAGMGTGMNLGLKAAFDEINAKGGVHGRKIRFVSADDGYEPDKCVDCTEKMIEETGVFALAGYVGTP